MGNGGNGDNEVVDDDDEGLHDVREGILAPGKLAQTSCHTIDAELVLTPLTANRRFDQMDLFKLNVSSVLSLSSIFDVSFSIASWAQ